jgi:hypothetical protein
LAIDQLAASNSSFTALLTLDRLTRSVVVGETSTSTCPDELQREAADRPDGLLAQVTAQAVRARLLSARVSRVIHLLP